jgi:hypothetical protein
MPSTATLPTSAWARKVGRAINAAQKSCNAPLVSYAALKTNHMCPCQVGPYENRADDHVVRADANMPHIWLRFRRGEWIEHYASGRWLGYKRIFELQDSQASFCVAHVGHALSIHGCVLVLFDCFSQKTDRPDAKKTRLVDILN